MKTNPLISVIIPAYNSSQTIEEALKSVITQTYQNFEIIIIDDCSTDNTVEVIKEFIENHPKHKIILIVNKENSGPAKSRNRGIEISNGEYISLLDSDDFYVNNKLEKQIQFLKNNKEFIACSSYLQCFGLQNNIVTSDINPERMKDEILIGIPFLHATICISKEFIITHQLFYNTDMRYSEDYDWAIRLINMGGKIQVLDEVLYNYRISGNQASFIKNQQNQSAANPLQLKASKDIHYKIWDQFMNENHSLYNLEFIDCFLRHKMVELSKIDEFIAWFNEVKEFNKTANRFSEDFLHQNLNYVISTSILGQTQFNISLLKKYFQYKNYLPPQSFITKIKFVLKSILKFKYTE